VSILVDQLIRNGVRYIGSFGHGGLPPWTGIRCPLKVAVSEQQSSPDDCWSLTVSYSGWPPVFIQTIQFRRTKLGFGPVSAGSLLRPIFRFRIEAGPFFDLRIVPRSGPRIDLRIFQGLVFGPIFGLVLGSI
jgi:hypothetical protein